MDTIYAFKGFVNDRKKNGSTMFTSIDKFGGNDYDIATYTLHIGFVNAPHAFSHSVEFMTDKDEALKDINTMLNALEELKKELLKLEIK